ncbi:pantetheine-phosphate adenylyltransferase [Myxococcota bacterium]|jgi:pantetheine-phosphate adenylyltransferase|nr:pantetheine-phosphate adenylyltransferase [Myxococcota bacterium]MBU1411072.1 pantetheine-phosphate adenylyltransferase [Myxococcota bacterium]MBU1511501.1 pantetheine-phosphate adenylyltransferase [Myxococcota bacterium]PKN25178.1 MAG: pantetheine-phosphate adenylyltransferase [Deltaproteobacteria bacterium HGW-Deltaproteobacteria-22]
MSQKTAVYPGSFDPITLGHVDLVRRGLVLFDEIVVAVAINSTKNSLFTLEERVELIRATFADEPRVRVTGFEGLLVDYLKQNNIQTLLRGLRAISDFDYEFQISQMNRALCPEMDTVFLMTGSQYFYLSSSVIKEVARFGGDVSAWVPEVVGEALLGKFGNTH